jgi:hypothetical protein
MPAMNISDRLPYHPRPVLLESVSRMLVAGSNITLFAPRRQGKTQFVIHELLPGARELGWFAARIDLWRNRDDPALGLVEGLEAIAAAKRHPGLLSSAVRLSKLKVGVKLAGVEAGSEWELIEPPSAPPATTLENRLAAAMHAIAGKADNVLLALDEFQALASANNPNFIAAFRTVVQDLEGRVTLFYTGSSRSDLNSMFRKAKAPLFQSAKAMQLPALDRAFVQSRVDYLKDVAGLQVKIDGLESLFLALESTPLFLNEIVVDMLAANSDNIPAAVDRWLEDKRDNEIKAQLDSMRVLDRAVARWLATPGERSVYTAEARAFYAEDLVNSNVRMDIPDIQNAVRRLTKTKVIEPTGANGEYEHVDRGFLIILRELRGFRLLDPSWQGQHL